MSRERSVKPKNDAHPYDKSTSPDQWNDRSDIIDSYNDASSLKPPVESSIPIGELAFKTEGFAPRSRAAFTRTADDRINHFIDQYSKQSTENFRGKTFMPPECIPNGRVFLWARKTVSGRPDDHNIGNLQSKHGWQVAQADEYPGYGFYADDGSVNDSAGVLYMGGLMGMDRDERIHNAQLNRMAKLRKATDSQYEDLKSKNPNAAPRSQSNMEAYNDIFFPSTENTRSHTSSF